MLNNINKFLDAYIWSQEVKDLIKKENHQFTDRDMAAIVWNDCVKPLAIRHSALRKIIEYSDDGELKIQIEDRIKYDEDIIKSFYDNIEGYVFELYCIDVDGDKESLGFYENGSLAWQVGVDRQQPFHIRKYVIKTEKHQKIKAWALAAPWFNKDSESELEEIENAEGDIAEITYDAHGEIITYYSNELSKDRYIAINTLSNKRFENAYVVIPNPFEYGDRVTFRNSEKLGTIATRKEQWNSLIRKGIQTDSIFDWSDASVVVEWDDGSHSHINPIYLRKIDNNRCKIIPLFSIYCYNIIVFGVLYNQIRACRKENGK